MLHVVDQTETDEFGNVPDPGGVLVVGFDYTLWAAPIDGATHSVAEDGFIPWGWVIMTSGPQKEGRMMEMGRDSTFVPEDEVQSKAVLLCAADAVKQLALSAGAAEAQALRYELARVGMEAATAQRNVRQYEGVARAHRLAEWVEGVEAYLHYQRWLCGY